MQKLLQKFISFSQSYYIYISLFFLLFTLWEISFLSTHFTLNSDLKALFKGSNKTVQDLQYLENRIGSTLAVDIVATSKETENTIAFMRKLENTLSDSPLIRHIEFERDTSYLEKRALLFLPLEELDNAHQKLQSAIRKEVKKQLALTEPETSENKNSVETSASEAERMLDKIKNLKEKHRIEPFLSAENNRFIAMKVFPAKSDTSMGETIKILNHIKKEIAALNPKKHKVTIEAGGAISHKIKEKNLMEEDISSTLLLCLLLLAATLIFYFRSLSVLPIILIPLSIGIVTAISCTMLIVTEFTLISAFSFALLFGLGIDFGIHLLSRYSEEKEDGKTPVDALKGTYLTTIPAITAGALTTAIAFFSLFLIEFKGFSDFGLVAGVGIISSLASIMLFFPSLIFLFEKLHICKIKKRNISLLAHIFTALSKHRKTTIASTIIIILLSAVSLLFVQFEYNLSNLSYPKERDSLTLVKQFRNALNHENKDQISRTIPNYILTNSLEETHDVHRTFSQHINNQPFPVPAADIISLYTFIPEHQKEKLRIAAKIKGLIRRKINLFPDATIMRIKNELFPLLDIPGIIKASELPKWIRNYFTEKDGSYGKVIKITVRGAKMDIQSVAKIKKYYSSLKGRLKTYKIYGTYFLLADIKKVIAKDTPVAIFLAYLAVLIALLITFRSLKDALIVLAPLTVGLLVMVGVAVITNIRFNLFNMVAVPTVVGIGIDASIHLFTRIKAEGNTQMKHILSQTGGAILFSSLTTFVSFASIAAANHNGLNSIGIIASIGICTITCVTLVLFPIFLTIRKNAEEE